MHQRRQRWLSLRQPGNSGMIGRAANLRQASVIIICSQCFALWQFCQDYEAIVLAAIEKIPKAGCCSQDLGAGPKLPTSCRTLDRSHCNYSSSACLAGPRFALSPILEPIPAALIAPCLRGAQINQISLPKLRLPFKAMCGTLSTAKHLSSLYSGAACPFTSVRQGRKSQLRCTSHFRACNPGQL